MPTYRLYFLNAGAHISTPPKILECADNEEAVRMARQYIDGRDLELWREGTLIVRLPKKGSE